MTPTVPATEPVPETCGEAFNSAWQCYAPTFQLTQYYRYGELDSCAGRWAAIWACMDKSKRDGQSLSAKSPVKVAGARERGTPYWELLDPSEAEVRWRRSFGKNKIPPREGEGGAPKP